MWTISYDENTKNKTIFYYTRKGFFFLCIMWVWCGGVRLYGVGRVFWIIIKWFWFESSDLYFNFSFYYFHPIFNLLYRTYFVVQFIWVNFYSLEKFDFFWFVKRRIGNQELIYMFICLFSSFNGKSLLSKLLKYEYVINWSHS